MKILVILARAIVGAAILWWLRPSGFNARSVAMPQAMSWQTLNAARQAAERPTGMTYAFCKYPACKRG